jgi:hypothetical protein
MAMVALGGRPLIWSFFDKKRGARAAELMEAPIMLAVSVVAARWVVWRMIVPHTPCSRLGMALSRLD